MTDRRRCNYPLDPPRAQQKVWTRRFCRRPIGYSQVACWQHESLIVVVAKPEKK